MRGAEKDAAWFSVGQRETTRGMSTATNSAGWPEVAQGRRWLTWLAVAAALLGLALLALNLYGLTQPLRGPLVASEVPGRMYGPAIPENVALARLRALDASDRRGFALEAAEIIGEAMSHIDWRTPTSAEIGDYRMTVPVWENYLLYAARYLKPDTYRIYEFCSWRRALGRGIGQCGQQSSTVMGFLAENGFNAAIVYLEGHVVATAEVAPGEWYVLDPDYRAYMAHDLDTLRQRPELLRAAYAHNKKGHDGVGWMYVQHEPRLVYGGPEARHPKGCVIEEVAYVLKWAIPAVLLVGAAGLFGFGRRRTKAA